MSVVYPGLVNVETSTITVNTLNVYDHGQDPLTFDLSNQIPDHNQPAITTFNLPSPAKISTLMVFHDGLLLSPYNSATDEGDYTIPTNQSINFLWTGGLKKVSSNDTPVLIVRYQPEASV